MNRNLILSLLLAAGLVVLLCLTFSMAGNRTAAGATAPCGFGDVDCDGIYNIVDLQSVAARIGAQEESEIFEPGLDLDENGRIDLDDLLLLRPAWRLPRTPATGPVSDSVGLAGGPPRLGYAVDDNGQVFLRWQIPASPYNATVEILRQPAPPTAPPAGRPGVGVIAAVDPIWDDVTALPLLGDQWEYLRGVFSSTVDAEGVRVPLTLTTVAEMHEYIQQGTNPYVVQTIANQEPGVARVLGKGYWDTEFTAAGVYTYWIRVRGRIAGPVRVDTTSRTQLPPPQSVTAFEGTVNVPAGGYGAVTLQNMKRGAHASIYLRWNPDLGRRPSHPEWQHGFNVWRQACTTPANCGDWVRVNELPIFPKAPADETLETQTISTSLGISVTTGTEIHDFGWFWADSNLDTTKTYCYRVTALDLLQQEGQPSTNAACLRPPDYLPPATVEIVGVTIRPPTQYVGYKVEITMATLPDDERSGDTVRYILYRAERATEPWPSGWTVVDRLVPDGIRPTWTLRDDEVAEHDEYWYRVVAEDAAGNRSIPGAPVIARVDDTTPPETPSICAALPGQTLTRPCFSTPADAAFIRVYRRFATDGTLLLLDRVPVDEWGDWTDSYVPLRQTQVYYQVMAEDEAGNVSGLSSQFRWSVGEGQIQTISTPVITDTQIISDGGDGFHGVITWQTPGTQNLREFKIYRQDGQTPPTNTDDMMEVGTVTVERRPDLVYSNVYSFTDTFLGIDDGELVWYVVEAVPLIGSSKVSQPFPARTVDLADLSARPMERFEVNAQWEGDRVTFWLPDRAACCYILFRSRDGANDFTQITPIVAGSSFVDRDVRPGDTAFYQILQLDAGLYNPASGEVDVAVGSGEIIAHTPVFKAPIPPVDPPAVQAPTPPVAQQNIGNLPAKLQFGPNWIVQMRHYTGTTNLGNGTFRLTGEGAVRLQPLPNQSVDVRVSMAGVIVDSSGVVQGIDPAGYATVHVNALPVLYPDRVRYILEAMRLDQSGALADVTIYSFGFDLRLWLIKATPPGAPDRVTQPNLRILDPGLTFEHTVAVSQGCGDDPLTLKFPFAVAGWPLLIVPTESFTVSHAGVAFGATCTLYRERFVDEDRLGASLLDVLDYRNDGFLRPSYSSSSAVYMVSDGLTGSWTYNAAHSYRTAFPFEFEISADAWRFDFVNGRMAGGAVEGGDLAFRYRDGVSPLRDFAGSFGGLAIAGHGAFSGTVQSDAPVRWTQFGLTSADYDLYVPPALSPHPPRWSWILAAGRAGSGIAGDPTLEPGINAQNHTLTWQVCPESTPAQIAFPAGSGVLDLYLRRGGVSGVADYLLSPPTEMRLAGYATELTRFGLSWFDNVEVDSAVAGSIYLPYPANITLRFDSLMLLGGCVEQGQVLPNPQMLDYWNVPLTPSLVDLRETATGSAVYKLWVQGEAEINHLAWVDGSGADIVLDLPFNPDGTVCDACEGEIFPQDGVYEVDDFYVTLKDLRFSDYASREAPSWDARFTVEDPPAVGEGFVELTAGIYLPLFGEVTDPNSGRILLLGDQAYIGFADQPVVDQPLSEALDVRLRFPLVYAQGQGNTNSRWIGAGSDRLLKVGGETIAEIPQGLVMEPGTGRIVTGFPAMSALFLAADEAYSSWPGRSPATATDAARFDQWRDELGIDVPILDFEPALAAFFVGQGISDYRALIDAIDAEVNTNHDGQVDSWITGEDLDLVHYQFPLFRQIMDDSPVQIKWVRGEAVIQGVVDGDGRLVDGTLDTLSASTLLKVYTNPRAASTAGDADQAPLLQGAMHMVFDAQGWISLEANGIQGELLADQLKLGSLDAGMRLLFSASLGYGVEGGLTLHNLQTDMADISKAGAVAGFTIDKPSRSVQLLYVGAFLDITLDLEVIGRINVGGSMLFGRLDSDSPVLEEEYGDLFDDMDASGIIEGGYVLVYANNIPIFQVGTGCLGIGIKGGGEVATWVFTRDGVADTAWGVRLGVNAMGEAFCIASAKADISLTLDNDFGQDNLDLTGKAWAGAGCGDCEPEEWRTKADVYDDKWCLKCVIDLYFVIPLAESNTKSDFTFSAECPF